MRLTWTAAVVAGAALAASATAGCSLSFDTGRAEDPAERPEPFAWVASTFCPAQGTKQSVAVPFAAEDPADPEVDALLGVRSAGRRHCVSANLWDAPEGYRLTSYTVAVPDGPNMYGQSFTTTDAEGSEELLHFPFYVNRHGGCAEATATMVMTDPDGATHDYSGTVEMGPRC